MLQPLNWKNPYIRISVASLTKMFTTIIALQQLERGNIGLNTTVSTYVPEFSCMFVPESQNGNLRVFQLMGRKTSLYWCYWHIPVDSTLTLTLTFGLGWLLCGPRSPDWPSLWQLSNIWGKETSDHQPRYHQYARVCLPLLWSQFRYLFLLNLVEV